MEVCVNVGVLDGVLYTSGQESNLKHLSRVVTVLKIWERCFEISRINEKFLNFGDSGPYMMTGHYGCGRTCLASWKGFMILSGGQAKHSISGLLEWFLICWYSNGKFHEPKDWKKCFRQTRRHRCGRRNFVQQDFQVRMLRYTDCDPVFLRMRHWSASHYEEEEQLRQVLHQNVSKHHWNHSLRDDEKMKLRKFCCERETRWIARQRVAGRRKKERPRACRQWLPHRWSWRGLPQYSKL